MTPLAAVLRITLGLPDGMQEADRTPPDAATSCAVFPRKLRAMTRTLKQ